MKKNYLKKINLLLVSFIFIIGCQKEIKVQPGNTEIQPEELKKNYDGAKNGCRMTVFDYYDGIADLHAFDYYTYKSGLVDEWAVWYGGVYKMEYDDRSKLKKSKYYVDDVLVYTIHFIYKNDKVVKEIWFVEDTEEVSDEVFYTFDSKGQIIRGESFIWDYYTDNTYTSKGELVSWKFHLGDSPVVSGHYTYYNHYKSPFVDGTPGIEYNFPYSNSTFGYSKRWYSSEKIITYDENGNPTVYYDHDPGQTQWHTGNFNNLTHVEYIDALSGTHFSIGFDYENCMPGDNNSKAQMTQPPSTITSRKITPKMLLQRNPSKSLKEQVVEFRRQLKK